MKNPNDYIITRKRKKYKFALFENSPLCFEFDEWPRDTILPNVAEVGAGTGLFATALAQQNPEASVLAVDVKADRLITGARLAVQENISNIHFLRSRVDLLHECLTPASLQQLWITFPDPFPKKGSAGRRLTHQKFLALYKTLLAKNGALYFKTDARDLFTWSLEQLVADGWRIEELSFDLHESLLDDAYKIKTTYETRFTAEDLPIYFVKASF